MSENPEPLSSAPAVLMTDPGVPLPGGAAPVDGESVEGESVDGEPVDGEPVDDDSGGDPALATGIDEMVDGQRGLRPHWRHLLGTFSSLGVGGLADQVRRMAVAFDDEGASGILQSAGRRVWRCDPLPLPIVASEFAALTEGLAQRAELLEAILRDIYGPQTLLSEGHLPPATIYANDSFLRACRSDRPRPPGHRFMDFYAADLIRAPDGQWRVLADRTVGAAGLAYALENRDVLARVVPEVFRGAQMRPLRPFFDVWQGALQRLGHERAQMARFQQTQIQAQSQMQFAGLVAPVSTGPGIAMLTPGTASRHWFEHMMLARELSCALVEGGDLTVRGGVVFLKTLKGLQRVDVLLNRIDPRRLDPLELDSGSNGGVTGLMDAIRTSAIHVSNDPGAGAVEAPALAAWLPFLSQHLLGEALKLESVQTLWLGDAVVREAVLRDFDRWRIHAATDRRSPAIEPWLLGADARAALLADIARKPWRFCATRFTPPSVAPCVGPNGMEPKPIVLRVYLVFDGMTWHAMDGGLARVVEPGRRSNDAAPQDRISKDVWVLHDDGRTTVGVPSVPAVPIAIRRTTGDLPSRVADNMFWLGRYVERLEGSARLVRATIARLSRGDVMPHELVELAALSRSLVKARLIPAESVAVTGGATALLSALFGSLRESSTVPGPIADLIASVAQLTELVRDRLTGDMYAAFTTALRQIRQNARAVQGNVEVLSNVMVDVLRFSASVAGMAAENMVRGGGWLFLELGRRMERAQSICTQVGFALEQPPARVEPALKLVLELCDSLITYRTRYLTVLQPAPVLDLVLADSGNPRGLAFQLEAIAHLLDQIEGPGDRTLSRDVAAVAADVQLLVQRVADAPDQADAASALPATLHRHAAMVAALSDRVTRNYFALLPAPQSVGTGEETQPLRGAA